MLCTPESPEAALLAGPNAKFFQYSLHGQEWAVSAFPTSFQMPQAVEVPMKHERGWDKYSLSWRLNNNRKDMEEQRALMRQDLQTLYLPKSRKEARLWMSHVEQPLHKEQWPQGLLLTHLMES